MIILIIAFGLVLRLINLNQSFWLDEAISALAARDFSYYSITFEFLKIDNHPPLFYLLLKFWGQLFGFTDWILRVLPVIMGTVLIYVIYKISLLLTANKKIALTSGLLVSTSPLLVYYSQEVRMYILISLLCAIQIYLFLNLLKKPRFWKWSLFSILMVLVFFSDYITVFFLPIFFLYPLFIKDKQLFIKVLLAFIPLLVIFGSWSPMFSEQLLKNKNIVDSFPGWQYVVGGATFKNLAVIWMKFVFGRISFDPKLLYYSLVAIASVPILFGLFKSTKQFKSHLLIRFWLFIPVIFGFTFSFLIPVFNYFRFIYVLPALLILVAIGISHLKNKTIRIVLISSIILSNLIGLSIYYLDPQQSRENWRQAVKYIESSADSNSLVVFEFYDAVAPYRWYAKGTVNVIGAASSYTADPIKTPEKMSPSLIGKNKIYHFEYLRDLTDPQKIVEQKLEQDGFIKGEVLNDFKNIGQLSIWTR